ncbi:succinate dehydrogenase, hydrophobic membrane anchor protein [Azospirillum sp. ST 5-10]|uniref:succinate dehydrogenase, hydrophobic membrane anchor protein n=1 Tax=unclassified Azospirillum TaxID=2630922 RepID=UPI003F49E4F1
MSAHNKNTLRDPLGNARGLGSAKHGTDHWWHQRLTALALVPLTLWFVLAVIIHLGADYGEMVAWLRSPYSAAMMILFVAVGFHHAAAGMQVVFEDYVHNEWAKVASIIVTKFVLYALAAICIVSVLKLTFGV